MPQQISFLSKILLMIFLTIINSQAKTIAKIPEASGIEYVKESNSLFVANDEGAIYELSKKGKVLRKKDLGDYDLEGVAYNKSNDTLLLAIEGKESILVLDRVSLNILKIVKIKRKFDGVKILKKSKKTGIEAIAIDTNGDIYLSNQSKITDKKKLIKNASVVFKINFMSKNKAKISEVFNHGYVDISGLTFHDNHLFMTSDKENLLIKYDIQNNKTVKKIKLPKSGQEGICFDEKYVYIADDNGRILRYKKDKLGI